MWDDLSVGGLLLEVCTGDAKIIGVKTTLHHPVINTTHNSVIKKAPHGKVFRFL